MPAKHSKPRFAPGEIVVILSADRSTLESNVDWSVVRVVWGRDENYNKIRVYVLESLDNRRVRCEKRASVLRSQASWARQEKALRDTAVQSPIVAYAQRKMAVLPTEPGEKEWRRQHA